MTTDSTLALDCRCTLGEGILWSPKLRSCLWTDIEQSRLWLYRPHDRLTRKWSLPDRLGSFAMCESGRLLLGLAKSLAFVNVDNAPDGALTVDPIIPIEADVAGNRVNDGRTDRAGNFVFGTMSDDHKSLAGSIYQYSSRYGLRRLDIGAVAIANSICFSGDGRVMYFCDSPTGVIRRGDYDAESARVTNICEFTRYAPGTGFPDGSVVDSDNCLWNAVWGAGIVRRLDPGGTVLSEISFPAKNVTCPAFGGDSLDRLYVTSSRQEMSEQELQATPTAGSVFSHAGSVRGICDALFRD